MTATFTPFYAPSEIDVLFRLLRSNRLDKILSRGSSVVGLRDCEMRSQGVVASPLASRFTSKELLGVVRGLASEAEPLPTYAVVLMLAHVERLPIEAIARAFGCECASTAQSLLINAQDELMRRLLSV